MTRFYLDLPFVGAEFHGAHPERVATMTRADAGVAFEHLLVAQFATRLSLCRETLTRSTGTDAHLALLWYQRGNV